MGRVQLQAEPQEDLAPRHHSDHLSGFLVEPAAAVAQLQDPAGQVDHLGGSGVGMPSWPGLAGMVVMAGAGLLALAAEAVGPEPDLVLLSLALQHLDLA